MSNAKKGLRLLSFSIILNIGWSVIYAILGGIAARPDAASSLVKFIGYGTLITAIVLVLCYLIDLYGLHTAGKDNRNFHHASFLKIASLVLAVVCLILGIIVVAKPSTSGTIDTITNVVSIFTSIAEVVALFCIVKGCKEISPRVKGQANFVLVCFLVQIVCMIVLSFLAVKAVAEQSEGTIGAVGVLAIIFAIASLLYMVNYVILIFRATANVGKSR